MLTIHTHRLRSPRARRRSTNLSPEATGVTRSTAASDNAHQLEAIGSDQSWVALQIFPAHLYSPFPGIIIKRFH